MKEFYMIFCPEKQGPKFIHDTLESAEKEAKRLASDHVGHTFYILAGMFGYKVEKPEPSLIVLERGEK